MFNTMLDLWILFAASFLAATLFPAQSEAVLAGLTLHGAHSSSVLVAVATLGNVLGACLNWLLGRTLMQFKERAWFPIKERNLLRAENIFKRFGVWTLLFSWLPFIGDPITFIAGIFRVNIILFLILVTAGKLARYIAVVILVSG